MPEATQVSQEMARCLSLFLAPLLSELDARLDVRLVRTFAATLVNLVRRRDGTLSLLLTELGEALLDGARAPAGVKRLWRLLHSPNWQPEQIDTWLAEQASQAVEGARARDGVAFAVLDDSEVEKPAARRWEGLSKVRSSRARRLQRAGGGPPPARPTLVPGFGWVAVVVTGLKGSLTLARWHWFSPKAFAPERRGEAERRTVLPFVLLWAEQVIWLVDRGFGNATFLGEVFARVRFVARWRPAYLLVQQTSGEVAKASGLSRKVRSRWTRQVRDPWTKQTWTVGIASIPVSLPGDARELWLVVARRKGKSQTLWLLTTEDASTEHGATFVVQAYTRRWQVEWAIRFQKSGLGISSVRVESWTYREKLWRIAALVHAFLLHLLVVLDPDARARLLRWCHRTGQRYREAIAPLYRLRHALANLWTAHPPTLACSP
jgi:hypothetical protein